MVMINHEFWQAPPWQGGVAKHRLGLRPVQPAAWLSAAPSQPELVNKRAQLEQRYQQVVGKLSACAEIDRLLLSLPLPAQPESRYPDVIANVALTVADDLCVLDVPDCQRLVQACVCAPSYWRLADKLGRPLAAVHAAVPGMNEKIGTNIERFIERAPLGQPFARSNWFLHGDASLYHAGEEGRLTSPVDCWFVRSERQTLCRLSETYLLFTIRIICEPLCHIAGYPSAQADLMRSLDNMDVQEIEHFGGVEKHRRLAEYVALCLESA